MKILVTGFTPFGGEQINPSWEAARRLPNRIGGAELIKHEIPTEFDASGAALHKLLTELRPDAVLCVGQYGGANCIRVERVAINLPEQTKDGNAPSMGLEMMVKALHIAVEAIAEEEKQ